MTFIRFLDRLLFRLELAVSVLAMTGLVVLLIAQVICRYLLQSPLFFAEEAALVLMIVATFAGFSMMVAEGRLITIDLFGGRVSARTHAGIGWAMRLAVLGLAAALAAFSIRYLTVPWVWAERSATLGLPRAQLYAIVTAELCFLVFHQSVQLVDTWPARGGRQHDEGAT
ncbi:TRAP transporter small permease [Roseibium aggregatum]|uniref:TRAP transporter small permease n=1 Tax=Roseibium aggregatum TaxID=187304 RepID=UPI003A977910